MQAYGIFEGGGAKGLAHVAAIAEAQALGIRFVGVAGASAGAIVAALIAVGYKPKGLYDPSTRAGLMSADLTDMFGPGKWDEWKRFSAAIEQKLNPFSALGLWCAAPGFLLKWRRPLSQLVTEFGFLASEPIEAAVDQWLRGGAIQIPPDKERLLFSDLAPEIVPPLRIIASDVETHSPVVFSREGTPDVPVAKAVAASMAIPFLFKPVQLEVQGKTRTLVDGGLVSNFPVWIFNDERRKHVSLPPILGFRLQRRLDASRPAHRTFLDFAEGLLETALNGNIEIHARGIDDLFMFPIEVQASTYEFDMTADRKQTLYEAARKDAGYLLLRDLVPRNPRVLSMLLAEAMEIFRKESGLGMQLRANLTLPTTRNTLRIVAGMNMEDDADDRLELELNASASGECWEKHKIVILDVGTFLRRKQPIPGVNKYQQALVRPTLSTIISIPIFDPRHFLSERDANSNPLIGILNFDSDSATVTDFEGALSAAEKAAVSCGQVLSAPL
jgi:predicted acylesterase/phospholipase RssA